MGFSDQLRRFTFQDSDVRGELIHLGDCYRTVLSKADYPPPVGNLLGQFLAAAGLLSTTLKFDGVLNIQARGKGPLKLIMADCTRHHYLRGIARLDQDTDVDFAKNSGDDTGELLRWLGAGHMAITIDPVRGSRYQGLVPMERPSFAACVEQYFEMSEQLPTRIWLTADSTRACGLLLQALPPERQSAEQREREWQHLTCLANTITSAELLELEPTTLLTRLFHEETISLFEPQPMTFACSCSRQRTCDVLLALGRNEAMAIVEEQGLITIDCQFCGQQYRFSHLDVVRLFDGTDHVIH